MTQTETLKSGTRSLWVVVVLSAIGIALSLVLTHQFYQLRTGEAGFHSFCNVGQSLNCNIIAASRFAELFGGIPLSSFSGGWFLALAVIALLSLSPDWRRDGIKAAFAMACFGAILSLGYFLIMAFVLKTYCLFCLFIDGINFALVATLYFLHPFAMGKTEEGRWKTVGAIILGSLLVSVVFGKSMDTYSLDSATAQQYADSTLNAPVMAVNSGNEFPSFGPKDAPITIVEFSDFQCPYCRIGAFTLNTVMSRYPNQVRVVFRAFPLDPSCNPLIQGHGHNAACEAARTALCAQKQGKFQEVYEQFFQNQEKIGPGKAAEMAKEAGAIPDKLAACVSTPEIANAITRDIEEGKRLDVKSTPTFFINGRKVEGAYPSPIWNLIIDRLLASPAKP